MHATAAADAVFRYPKPTDEDLPALAQLAYDVSARECGACRNYHVKFPYLRSIGAHGNGAEHCWPIARAALREVVEEGAEGRAGKRWLIAGAADAGIPALVRSCTLDRPHQSPAVTVVDRCGTPLALSRAYAEAVGWSIDCVKCDLLAYAPDEAFDIILFHYTIGFFDEVRRMELLRRARQWLAPGGRVVAFVYYDGDDIDRPASQRAMLRWQRSVIEQAVKDGELLLPEDLQTFLWRIENSRVPAMEIFKRRRVSLEDIKTAVHSSGFTIAKLLDLPTTKEEVAATRSKQRPKSLMVLGLSNY